MINRLAKLVLDPTKRNPVLVKRDWRLVKFGFNREAEREINKPGS
uniref:Uncharacterized protein n=1 Tax=Candidatus Kentrum sp. LFY TaxID=2126342 RepID=A0A450WYN3_9GAMM|nr:MAG: hypothetical protein BECKLFY1418C_GA0070996_11112 [Candidatus Kentron sp. LFY]